MLLLLLLLLLYRWGGSPYIQGCQLDVGVLVPYALLQRAHGVFRLHCLGPNHVGDFEVERHVLSARRQYELLALRRGPVRGHVQA